MSGKRPHRSTGWGPSRPDADARYVHDAEASYPTFQSLPEEAYGNYRIIRRPATYPQRVYFRRYYAPRRHAGVPPDFTSRIQHGDSELWRFHNAERRRLLHNYVKPFLERVDGAVYPDEWVKTYAERARLPLPVAADDILRTVQGEPIRERYMPRQEFQDQTRFVDRRPVTLARDDPEWINRLDQYRFGLGHHSFAWDDRYELVRRDYDNLVANRHKIYPDDAKKLEVDADIDPTEMVDQML